MKKLLMILFLLTGITVAGHAQITKKSPEQRAAHITKALSKKLNLTADQASQINAFFLAQATKMDSIKSVSTDKKANHQAKKSIALNTQQQVMAVLNSDQQQQFTQWEQMKKEKHKAKKAQVTTPEQG
jgi:methionine-rich copper-binding protein CopC